LIGFWFKVLVKELSNFQDMELENQTGWGTRPDGVPTRYQSLQSLHWSHTTSPITSIWLVVTKELKRIRLPVKVSFRGER
jgi:hypothetical protein